MTTKQAVDKLRRSLKDPGYYQTWKANIAMAFQDEFHRRFNQKTLWEISDKAADNFLELLCAERNKQ